MKLIILKATNDTTYGVLRYGQVVDMDEDDKVKAERWIKKQIAIEFKPKEKIKPETKPETKPVIKKHNVTPEIDLDALSLDELKAKAKDLKIPYYSQMVEETLKARISEQE